MRLGDERESGNFIDDTGNSGLGFGGGGGGLGCLLPLVFSRFGIGGVLVLVVGYFLLSSLGGLGGGGVAPSSQQPGASSSRSTLDPQTKHFTLQVLASTEDTWTALLKPKGISYTPTRFNVPGDFPQAYVLAHEVGHHVQDVLGTLGDAEKRQASESETEGNRDQVKIELQADCYAGVWAANAKNPEGQPVLEQGDIEEGMRAAEAIGDDTLQRETQGQVVPDSFTHGTSAQRMEALQRGYKSGNPDVCTF